MSRALPKCITRRDCFANKAGRCTALESNIFEGDCPFYKTKQEVEKTHVFICSPFAGDIADNAKRAIRYTRFALTQGVYPFTPHLLYPQILDENDPDERKLGMLCGLSWLSKCDEVWAFGTKISIGMAAEVYKAEKLNIPVRYFSDSCEEIVYRT